MAEHIVPERIERQIRRERILGELYEANHHLEDHVNPHLSGDMYYLADALCHLHQALLCLLDEVIPEENVRVG